VNSMKYVVSFASLAAVACFAVVMYTNPNLKNRFFKGATESEDFAFYESNQSTSMNNNFIDNPESYQDYMESVKENQTDSIPFETEESKEVNRVENDCVIVEDKDKVDMSDSTSEKAESFESLNEAIVAGTSSNNLKEIVIQKIRKAGFSVIEVEDYLKVKATKQELEDLLKDENVELEEQKDGIIVKLP